MIKKFVVLAAAAVFSLNASAGYVQYNLGNGAIVENTADKSIAFYTLNIGGQQFDFSGVLDNIYGQSSNFWGKVGPTNFSVVDKRGGTFISTVSFDFRDSGIDGIFNFTGNFSQTIDPGVPPIAIPVLHPQNFNFSGTTSASDVNPAYAYSIVDNGAYYADGIAHTVPAQNVPEPSSLALIAAGVLGAFGVARRRKA